MDQSEEQSIKEASEEVSREFTTLIDAQDLESLKQLQHLMYFPFTSLPLSACFRVRNQSMCELRI